MISGVVTIVFNDFPELAGKVQDAVDDALDQAALVTVAVADPLTRVDTGALRGNKTISRTSEMVQIDWNQEYAAYQEFGTYKMSGTHFATTGAEAGIRALMAELRGMF